MTPVDFQTVLPEVVLALYAMGALLFAVYTGKDKLFAAVNWATVGVLAALALWIGFAGAGAQTAFDGMFVDDAFSRFAKIVVLLSAAAVLAIGQDYMAKLDMDRFEYPILIALASVGMMMMVSAGDLIALYIGLELMSLSLYVVAAFRRDSVRSTEAGLKYFVLGSMSSGLLLYGSSLVYGFSGTTDFAGIISTMGGEHMPLGVLFGLVFMLAGLAFKVSAAPFHMWTPDVYEGSPTPVTAFFATAPKVAAMMLLARLVHDAFGVIPGDWTQVLALLSLLSMFLGAIAGIGQKDIKRLMAYSSIAHMGYALMGLASVRAGGPEFAADGVWAMMLYMVIYVTMNIGSFAFIMSLEKDGRPITEISALNMLSTKEPVKALALLVLMFSMAGVPPFLGFFAKFYVLKAAVDAGLIWLAVAGVVASVIGAFYYLRIVYIMYFGQEVEGVKSQMNAVQWLALVGVAAIMLVGIVNMFGIEPVASVAAQSLVR